MRLAALLTGLFCVLSSLQPPTSNLQPPTSNLQPPTSDLHGAVTDWPQFRGPDGQGHSSERGLPLEWSETKNVAWKVPVQGRGWSSPVVAGERVWLTTATPARRDTSLRLMAFDLDTGRTLLKGGAGKTR